MLADIRYGLRQLLKQPGFTFVVVLTLALGIGANTAIFSVVHAVLLAPLPYHDADRIAVIWETNARRAGQSNVVGPANFVRWQERVTAFEAIAGFVETRANLTGGQNPEEVVAQNITARFFSLLGVEPMLGRVFTAEEAADPQSAVVVLTYELWTRRFGADPAIIGRTIQLNGKAQTVVGVMPPEVSFFLKTGSQVGKPIDLWLPFVLGPEAREPRGRYLSVIARLKPGVSFAEGRAEMSAITASLAQEWPEFDTGWGAKVIPLRDELSHEVRPALFVLAAAVGFVLLIACANVANLLLARGAARQHELAIRSALGATRGQMIRQLLTESVLLGVIGGIASLLVAEWGVAFLQALSPAGVIATAPLQLNYPVLGFTAAITLLSALACGFAFAWEGSRHDVQRSLVEGGRQIGLGSRLGRLRHAAVIGEVALAVVLLVGAGLMLRSFAAMRGVDPGFDASNVLTMRMQLPRAKYADDRARVGFFRELTARLATLPGVQTSGAVSFLPMASLGAATKFTIEGQPPPPPGQDATTAVVVCDNGFFQALKVPLLRGRWFTEREMQEKSNVVVISESFARQYFPKGDAIGQRVTINMTDPRVPTEIIGVVGDMRATGLVTMPRPTAFWPHPQLAYNAMTLTLRTSVPPLSLRAAAEAQVRALDPDQPVSEVRTMEQLLGKTLAPARFNSRLLAIFAGLALVLAAVGIYGVMSYAVQQRTSEIGVRMAIGAQRRDVLRLVLGQSLKMILSGVALGLVAAALLTRAMQSLLFGVAAIDPVTFALTAFLLITVALLACFVPARRATLVDPIQALRTE